MTAKIDRALYGPSLFEVTFGAVLSVVLGVAVAFLFLVFKPVVIAKELPKEEDRVEATVYYVAGKQDSSYDRQWIRKRQMLLDGTPGDMTLSEDEINACLTGGSPKKTERRLPPRPTKPGEKPAPPPADPIPDELLTLDVANVRIRDGLFQVGVPASLNLIWFSVPVVLQAQGKFVKGDEMWEFKPIAVYLGSMPLHRVPGLTDLMIKRIAHSDSISEDAVTAWKRVTNVSLGGHLLHLTIGHSESTPAPTVTAVPAPAAVASPEPALSTPPATAPATSAPAAPATSVPTTSMAAPTTSTPTSVAPTPTTAPSPIPTVAPTTIPSTVPAPAATTASAAQ